MVPVDVAEAAAGLDDVTKAALQLLGLGEATVRFAVPERACCRRRQASGRRCLYLNNEDATRRRLERDLAKGVGEGRYELLGILVAVSLRAASPFPGGIPIFSQPQERTVACTRSLKTAKAFLFGVTVVMNISFAMQGPEECGPPRRLGTGWV